MKQKFEEILNKNNRESNFLKKIENDSNIIDSEILEESKAFYQDYIKPSVERQFEKLLDKDDEICDDYMDAEEYYIFQYINQIESFINNYGYINEIGSLKENSNIEEIENVVKDFLMKNANAWNHLEIFGTLKDFPDKKVYVCCYEPYGEELLCVEEKSNKLFFFKTPNYKHGIKMKHINYLDKFNFNDIEFN